MAKAHKEARELIDTLPELKAGNAEVILSKIDTFAEGNNAHKYAASLLRAFLQREWQFPDRPEITHEQLKTFISGEYKVTQYGAKDSGVGHHPKWAKEMKFNANSAYEITGALDLLALGANILKPGGRMVHHNESFLHYMRSDYRKFTGEEYVWFSPDPNWRPGINLAAFCGIKWDKDTGLFTKTDGRQVDEEALANGVLKGLTFEEYQTLQQRGNLGEKRGRAIQSDIPPPAGH